MQTVKEPELVKLNTYETSFQANLAKAKLQSEGIPAYIFDENMMNLNPLFNLSLGGIKLFVNPEDYERATLILSEAESLPQADSEDKLLCCPHCNSEQFERPLKGIHSPRAFFAFLISLLTLTYPLYNDNKFICTRCGKSFYHPKVKDLATDS